MKQPIKCPENYKPGCSCSISALEPDENCEIHGCPDPRVCPYCGSFRSAYRPCKRCGCASGIWESKPPEVEPT